jgi:hypothetical protein
MLTNDLQQTTSIDNERLLDGSDSDFETIVPILSGDDNDLTFSKCFMMMFPATFDGYIYMYRTGRYIS